MADARFRRSAGGVSWLGLHVVWCPKYRHRVLSGRVAVRYNQLLDEIAGENDWQIVAREVMADHVHVFVRVRPSDSPAAVVRRLKGRTSPVLRSELAWLGGRRVLWSKSYLAASVGYVSEATVRQSIEHQGNAA
jgi:putative transposase